MALLACERWWFLRPFATFCCTLGCRPGLDPGPTGRVVGCQQMALLAYERWRFFRPVRRFLRLVQPLVIPQVVALNLIQGLQGEL